MSKSTSEYVQPGGGHTGRGGAGPRELLQGKEGEGTLKCDALYQMTGIYMLLL